jgi:hypothetical protein
MSHETSTPARVRWARLRFAIIGPLLSAPAEAGDLAPRACPKICVSGSLGVGS